MANVTSPGKNKQIDAGEKEFLLAVCEVFKVASVFLKSYRRSLDHTGGHFLHILHMGMVLYTLENKVWNPIILSNA